MARAESLSMPVVLQPATVTDGSSITVATATDTITVTTAPAVTPNSLRLASAIAIAVIGVLNLLDLVTTRIMLAHGALESNPLSSFLLPSGSVAVVKAGIIVGLVFCVLRRRPSLQFTVATWFLAGFYFLTIVSNLLIIQRLG